MKLAWWMLAGSVLAALALTWIVGTRFRLEIWLGMLAPLVAALASWIAMVRHRASSTRGMTRLLLQAFAAKAIFFAVYIIALLKNHWVQPTQFVICFAGFYLALHFAEAMGLRRMQTGGMPSESDHS